ncbi:lytic transglycosylase domain-containing protein [Rubritepida flocculans]|uniref:lytic transglycosylase domain-containing protein n=1 Tax=Rubritepida flocculans TaxID=182403 RepID=UPI00040E96B8|nr:lytic transglycosylase domain-containing protein [Rubritepida flocculans]
MRRLLLALALLLPVAAAAQPPREAARQALAAAQAGRWGEAQSLAVQADPLIAKMVQWMRLTQRGGAASATEMVGFIESAADWPMQEALQRNAEALLAAEPDDALVLRFFAPRPARTLDGAGRHVAALLAAGRREEAARAARRAWAEDAPGDAAAEALFLERAGALLDAESHWRRYNRLWFARDAAGAERVAPLLDAPRRALAQLRAAGAEAEAAAAARDAGATLARARALRQRDADREAAAAWAAGAAAQQGLDAAAQRALWTERQVLARKLLRLGEPRLAYQVASQHGQSLPGEPRQEAEFLSGFIALRFLEDPARALAHFRRVREGSRSAITQARSLYWEGRAERDPARARARYQEAAAFPVTFYGQMAALALGENGAQISARINGLEVPRPSPAEARAFAGRELARLVALLGDLGEARRARIFLLRLEETSPSNAERLLVARLATAIGRPDFAVWVARRGGAQGAMLVEDGWPRPYPAPEGLAEPALVFAIARQESNFDPEAVSSANARGVMQLLPATATAVARRLGIPHRTEWLTTDPAHNKRLGAAYIQERLERFGGVLPFALAAYNAGTGRVEEWLVTYGDPRGGQVSMLDWMEQIPFGETRNYVQRVIENLAVYRAKDPRTAGLDHPMAAWRP